MLMELKEAYAEIKYFKEFYRNITKLGNITAFNGILYFSGLEEYQFFNISMKLLNENVFTKFISEGFVNIPLDSIQLLRGCKKKDVVDIFVDEKLTYRVLQDAIQKDIVFEKSSKTLDVESPTFSKKISLDAKSFSEELLEVFDGELKILEIPVKSLLIYNEKLAKESWLEYTCLESGKIRVRLTVLTDIAEIYFDAITI